MLISQLPRNVGAGARHPPPHAQGKLHLPEDQWWVLRTETGAVDKNALRRCKLCAPPIVHQEDVDLVPTPDNPGKKPRLARHGGGFPYRGNVGPHIGVNDRPRFQDKNDPTKWVSVPMTQPYRGPDECAGKHMGLPKPPRPDPAFVAAQTMRAANLLTIEQRAAWTRSRRSSTVSA